MYLWIRPSTTCLYSAASMCPRSLSAASQSLASKPRLAALPLVLFVVLRFAIVAPCPLRPRFPRWSEPQNNHLTTPPHDWEVPRS